MRPVVQPAGQPIPLQISRHSRASPQRLYRRRACNFLSISAWRCHFSKRRQTNTHDQARNDSIQNWPPVGRSSTAVMAFAPARVWQVRLTRLLRLGRRRDALLARPMSRRSLCLFTHVFTHLCNSHTFNHSHTDEHVSCGRDSTPNATSLYCNPVRSHYTVRYVRIFVYNQICGRQRRALDRRRTGTTAPLSVRITTDMCSAFSAHLRVPSEAVHEVVVERGVENGRRRAVTLLSAPPWLRSKTSGAPPLPSHPCARRL